MSESLPVPPSRPRNVTVAFWVWLAAATLTAALGLLQANGPLPLFFRLIGVVLVLAGLAQGFLAGRVRNGDPRFARAAVALAMTTVVLLAIIVFAFPPGLFVLLFIAVIMVLLVAGTFNVTRPAAQTWLNRDAKP